MKYIIVTDSKWTKSWMVQHKDNFGWTSLYVPGKYCQIDKINKEYNAFFSLLEARYFIKIKDWENNKINTIANWCNPKIINYYD